MATFWEEGAGCTADREVSKACRPQSELPSSSDSRMQAPAGRRGWAGSTQSEISVQAQHAELQKSSAQLVLTCLEEAASCSGEAGQQAL